MEETVLSLKKPLSSRIRKLPPRYSQHYFSPFQPIQSDTKTFVSMPNNAANFFGPQSYWAQMANRLINNVVDNIGGHYAAGKNSSKSSGSRSSEERLETFRKALRNENATRLQYQPLSEFKRKDSKEITEVTQDVRYPIRKRLQYAESGITSSAEIVQPRKYPSTLSPTAAYPPPSTTPSTTPSYSPPTEFGVLPSLLLRNPNARSIFYRLDKYANPQYPPGQKRKVFRPINPLPRSDSEFYRTPTSEIRRKPISRISSSTYYYQNHQHPESRDEKIFKEIKFRSALKHILADFRKQHPSSFIHSKNNARELSRIAQERGSKSSRRRRPQSRRIVHLPSRYESSTEEGYRRW
uniref:Uncharacterized protein n=1 Tax=Panagrolaimus sp. PS1159 TaxID=55785 RepID=A0AC35GA55_9BILA